MEALRGCLTIVPVSSGEISPESMSLLRQNVNNAESGLPNLIDLISLTEKAAPFASAPRGPFVILLQRECAQLNRLVRAVKRACQELNQVLTGRAAMDEESASLAQHFRANSLPRKWAKMAWADSAEHTLASWLDHLRLAARQLHEWSSSDGCAHPYCVRWSLLFSSAGLITAVKQSAVRSMESGPQFEDISVNILPSVCWSVSEVVKRNPDDGGVFICGVGLEGGRWPAREDLQDKDLTPYLGGTQMFGGGRVSQRTINEIRRVLPLPVLLLSPSVKKLPMDTGGSSPAAEGKAPDAEEAVEAVPDLSSVEWRFDSGKDLEVDTERLLVPVYGPKKRRDWPILVADMACTKQKASTWALASVAFVLNGDFD